MFQSLTKIFRDLFIDKLIIDKVAADNKELFRQAVSELMGIKGVDANNEKVKIIYTIHNFLFAKYEKKMVPEFIMPRLAFWSNMFFVFLWIIIFIFLSPYLNITPKFISVLPLFDILVMILLMFLSAVTYWSYHKAYYDSFLRTFVTTRKFVDSKK